MAIDISRNYHKKSFPVKVASAMNQYGHVFNTVLQANGENGDLALKGDYVKYDQYEADAFDGTGFAGVIRGAASEKDMWEIEVTSLPQNGTLLYLYNSPVSEYSELELQDERLYYLKSGEVVQGMQLIVNDVFTVSTDGITGTPVDGATVTYSNGKYVI